MPAALTTAQMERLLVERLLKDRAKRSNRIIEATEDGVNITVEISNLSYGMAMGVGYRTGEEPMMVVERVMRQFADAAIDEYVVPQ